MASYIWIRRQLPMTFEFRKVPAFRSILDRPILKGKINHIARLNYPLLFFLIAGCSTLALNSTDKSTNYVRPKTADWAPEPHFYGDLGLPNNTPLAMANGRPNGPLLFAESHAPKGTTSLRNYQIPLNLTTIFITIVYDEKSHGFSEIRITSSHSNHGSRVTCLTFARKS